MLPPKSILVPVDYSEPSKALVPYVKDMLAHFPAELMLVHGYGPEGLALSELALADPRLPEDVRTKEETRLQAFRVEHFPGRPVDLVVANGDAGVVLDHCMKTTTTDMVMLATRGLGPVRRMLLGSVTAKVLHDADCAVWTATGSAVAGHAPEVPYKSILCAVGDSAEAEAIVRAGALFAKTYGAKLSLLHVVEPPPASFEVNYGSLWLELSAAADFQLRELKGKLELDAPHLVVSGIVSDRVREQAIHVKADLIVTGRGRIQGRLSRLWAHLYSIVRDSPCPVLSV
jgi:nucleotide-binding universal stress UspA family protein